MPRIPKGSLASVVRAASLLFYSTCLRSSCLGREHERARALTPIPLVGSQARSDQSAPSDQYLRSVVATSSSGNVDSRERSSNGKSEKRP